MTQRFWETKTLQEMTGSEWESLCDGCGLCCLHRFANDDGEIIEVGVACRLLDVSTCRCTDYPNRKERVPSCVVLTPDTIDEFPWLPDTCAYRRLHEGRGIPEWHPLITNSADSVHDLGVGVRGQVLSERDVDPLEALMDLIGDRAGD